MTVLQQIQGKSNKISERVRVMIQMGDLSPTDGLELIDYANQHSARHCAMTRGIIEITRQLMMISEQSQELANYSISLLETAAFEHRAPQEGDLKQAEHMLLRMDREWQQRMEKTKTMLDSLRRARESGPAHD